jgi:hypothetical protein
MHILPQEEQKAPGNAIIAPAMIVVCPSENLWR